MCPWNTCFDAPKGTSKLTFRQRMPTLILTDSGGVQEEAPSLGKPVLLMRDTTERPEAVKAGTVKIVGTNQQKIVDETMHLLSDYEAYSKMAHVHNPYGTACLKIMEALKDFE